MGLTAEAYSRQIKQLLPRGRLWRLDGNSRLSKLILAISDELARVDARCDDLLNEWDPRTADEMIAEWESMLGIEPGTEDLDLRRLAVTGAFIAQGGATASYLVSIAENLGFSIDHVEYPVHDTITMFIAVAESAGASTIEEYQFCSGSHCGNPIYQKFSSLLEDRINKLKHAHIDALFAYI